MKVCPSPLRSPLQPSGHTSCTILPLIMMMNPSYAIAGSKSGEHRLPTIDCCLWAGCEWTFGQLWSYVGRTQALVSRELATSDLPTAVNQPRKCIEVLCFGHFCVGRVLWLDRRLALLSLAPPSLVALLPCLGLVLLGWLLVLRSAPERACPCVMGSR